jgi:LuxR family maltose regulon positive regulatory protein
VITPDGRPRVSHAHGALTAARIDARIDAALDGGVQLLVIRAPIGYGKAAIVERLTGRRREAGERIESLPLDEHLPDALASLLGELDGPATLVIRNATERRSPGAAKILTDGLRDTPTLGLVVTTRAETDLERLARLTLDLEVLDLDTLAVAPAEIVEAARSRGLVLNLDDATALRDQVAGWPVLVGAGLDAWTRDGFDLPAAARSAEGVLETILIATSLTEHDLEVAGSLSVLPHASDDDAVRVHGSDAAGVLRRFAAEGLAHRRPADADETWSMVPVVRSAMRRRLDAREPGPLEELRARAVAWAFDHDVAEVALRLSMDAEDWPHVAQAMDRWWPELVFGDHALTLLEVYSQIPERVRSDWPVVSLFGAFMGLSDAPPVDVGLPDDQAELAALGRSPLGPGALRRAVLAMAVLRKAGRPQEAADLADRGETVAEALLYVVPESGKTSPVALWHLHAGITAYFTGNRQRAERRWRAAYEWRSLDGIGFVGVDAAAKLAMLHAFNGDLRLATAWIERAEELPRPSGWLGETVLSGADIAALVVACERLDRDAAATARAALRSPLEDIEEFWPQVLVAESLHALVFGDPRTTLDLVDEVRRRRLPGRPAGGLEENLTVSVEVALRLALGQVGHADQVLRTAGDGPHLDLLRARLWLMTGRPEQAIECAHAAETRPDASITDRSGAAVVQAAAAHRLGDRPRAVRHARVAADLVVRSGAVRAFATVQRQVVDDLASEVPHLVEVGQTLDRVRVTVGYAQRIDLPQLTARERLVLHHLAQGLSAQRIADHLVVSVNTVKSQRRSLFRKLGVTSRDGAVLMATQLGLIGSADE